MRKSTQIHQRLHKKMHTLTKQNQKRQKVQEKKETIQTEIHSKL